MQVSPITAVAGQYVDGPIATFAAGDVQGTLANFQATIYWTGAVNLITSGSIAPSGPASYVVYSSNVYAKPGSYPVNVVITGANNTTAQASGTATITDAPLNTSPETISPLIQAPFSGSVASFQVSNFYAVSTDFAASINWGDGTAPPTSGTISSNGFNSFSVVGQHTYSAVGTFPVTVTVGSPAGQTNVINSTAVVTANPVAVLPTPVTGNAGQPLGGVTVATIVDPYTNEPSSTFQATVAWGDGTVNVGTIVGQGDGIYTVTGDHTYGAPGNYTINVQVVRVANGQSASTTSSATIGSPSPTFAFTGGLASVPSNGPFIASGYATTNRPTFDGTAAANALVQLFAQPVSLDVQLPLGQTLADSSGHWSMATDPLAPGRYVITAEVTPPAGYPGEMMALTKNNGTFFIDLSPGKAVANPGVATAATGTGPHSERSRTRHIAAHRASATHSARAARAVPAQRASRSSHRPKNT